MSNKANGKRSFYESLDELGLTATATIDEVVNKLPNFGVLNASVSGENLTPYPKYTSDIRANDGYLTIDKYISYRVRLTFSSQAGMIFTGDYNIGLAPKFSGWFKAATAEPPQEYNLPLAEGIITRQNRRNTYRKNQYGEVFVTLSVQSNNGEDTIDLNRGIAVLPAGFRPAYPKIVSGAAHNNAGVFSPIILSVQTDGHLIFGAGTSVFAVFGEMSFLATT